MNDIRLSDHPTDRLVRDLIQTPRDGRVGEFDRISDRMATAPFETALVPLPREEQGLSQRGRIVQERDDALFVHLVRRVLRNGQWALGTPSDGFVADFRRSIRSPTARLALYRRRGGNIAATIDSTREASPGLRQGPRPLLLLLVVYSADRGIILTGYQFASLDEVSIPEGAQSLP